MQEGDDNSESTIVTIIIIIMSGHCEVGDKNDNSEIGVQFNFYLSAYSGSLKIRFLFYLKQNYSNLIREYDQVIVLSFS